jgi:hypothetical protein
MGRQESAKSGLLSQTKTAPEEAAFNFLDNYTFFNITSQINMITNKNPTP